MAGTMRTLLLTIFIVFHFGCESAAPDEINGTNLIALENKVSTLKEIISDFQYKLRNKEHDLLRLVFREMKKNIKSLSKADQSHCYYAFIDEMIHDLSKGVKHKVEDMPCFEKFKVMHHELTNIRREELPRIRLQVGNLSKCIEMQNRTCEIEIKNLTASSFTKVERYLHDYEANYFNIDHVFHHCIRDFWNSEKDTFKKIIKSFEACHTLENYETILKRMSLWPLNLNKIANYTKNSTVSISNDVFEVLSPEGEAMRKKIAERRAILSDTLLNYTESIRNFLAFEKNNGIWDVRDVITNNAEERRKQVKPEKLECFNQSITDLKINITAYWAIKIFPRCFYPLLDIHHNISAVIWHNLTGIELQLGDTLDCEKQEVCMQSLRDILKIEVWFNFWKKVNLKEMKDNVTTCLEQARNAIDENIKWFENRFTHCEFVPATERIFDKLPSKTMVYLPFLSPDAQLDLRQICPKCNVLDTIDDPDYDINHVILENTE